MVSLRPWHSGKRVQILLRCCACDQVRFDLAVLKPEALERSPDDIGGSRRKYRDFGRASRESDGWRFRDRIEARIACRGRRRIWRQNHRGCRAALKRETPDSMFSSAY